MKKMMMIALMTVLTSSAFAGQRVGGEALQIGRLISNANVRDCIQQVEAGHAGRFHISVIEKADGQEMEDLTVFNVIGSFQVADMMRGRATIEIQEAMEPFGAFGSAVTCKVTELKY